MCYTVTGDKRFLWIFLKKRFNAMAGKTINLAKQFRIQAKNGRIIIAIILYKGTATIQHIK